MTTKLINDYFTFTSEISWSFEDALKAIAGDFYTIEAGHSCQSEASYFTLHEMDEDGEETGRSFCIRIATHPVINCRSQVDHNINLRDFITVVEDEDGCGEDDEHYADMAAINSAVADALMAARTFMEAK